MMIVFSFFIFLIYFFFNSNTIFGGDAGDLVSAILTRGFAHPPGYPLYTFLGTLFNQLPLALSPAGKVALISAASTAGALYVVYRLLKETAGKSFDRLIAFIVIAMGTTNYLVWLYAEVPEVFPLNTLIVSLILYFAVRFYRTGKIRYLASVSFFVALGITHHHTFLLIIPAVAYLILRKGLKKIGTPPSFLFVFFSFLLGLAPFIYLFAGTNKSAEVTWADIHVPLGFIQLLTRQGYGTFVAGPFISNFGPERFVQLVNIFYFAVSDFTPVSLLLIFLGIGILFKSKEIDFKLRLFFLISIGIAGPFFFFYANFPLRSRFEFATVERFYLMFYFLLLIPQYFGLVWAIRGLSQITKKITKTKIPVQTLKFLFSLVFFVLPIGIFLKNAPAMYALKNDRTAEHLGEDVINNTRHNSLFLLSTDTILFDSQYVYFSGKKRGGDRILIHASELSFTFYQNALKENYPDLKIRPVKGTLTIPQFIKDNLTSRTIYTNQRYPLPGLPDYKWVPQGFLFKLVTLAEENSPTLIADMDAFWNQSKNKDLGLSLSGGSPKWRHNFLNDIPLVYGIAHQNSAYFYLQRGLIDKALPHIKEAIVLNKEDKDSFFLLALYYEQKKQCREAEKTIMGLLNTMYDDVFINELKTIARSCYQSSADKTRIDESIQRMRRLQSKPLKTF